METLFWGIPCRSVQSNTHHSKSMRDTNMKHYKWFQYIAKLFVSNFSYREIIRAYSTGRYIYLCRCKWRFGHINPFQSWSGGFSYMGVLIHSYKWYIPFATAPKYINVQKNEKTKIFLSKSDPPTKLQCMCMLKLLWCVYFLVLTNKRPLSIKNMTIPQPKLEKQYYRRLD